jgi:hypothetical protein
MIYAGIKNAAVPPRAAVVRAIQRDRVRAGGKADVVVIVVVINARDSNGFTPRQGIVRKY